MYLVRPVLLRILFKSEHSEPTENLELPIFFVVNGASEMMTLLLQWGGRTGAFKCVSDRGASFNNCAHLCRGPSDSPFQEPIRSGDRLRLEVIPNEVNVTSHEIVNRVAQG